MSLAFGLGWDMTYLYTYVGNKDSVLPDLPDRLPSLARLSEQKRSLIRLDRIRGPICRFRDQFMEADVEDLKPMVDSIEEELSSGSEVDEVKDLLCDLHYQLMRAFSTADNRLAKAYRLGRSLATTCHVADSQEALAQEFTPPRLARLDEWLADLASQLPSHSSRPVRLSLSAWRDWLDDPRVDPVEAGDFGAPGSGQGRRPRQFSPRDRPLSWERDGKVVRATLRRQGDIWRALLSGEKRGDAMLELPDFISAAMKVPRRTLRLVNLMIVPILVSTFLITAGVALALSNDGVWKDIAGFGAIFLGVLGAIGFTWQGPLESLRRSTSEIKKPLWGAVLDEEIARAITDKPPGAIFEQEDAAIAAPAVGPTVGV